MPINSKYERAVTRIPVVRNVIESIYLNMGWKQNKEDKNWYKNDHIDKNYFNATGDSCGVVLKDIGYGNVGSSSWYSLASADLYQYLARAINELRWDICKKAISIAEGDIMKMKEDAKKEAQEILSEVV